MPGRPAAPAAPAAVLADALADHGWWTGPGLLQPALIRTLYAELSDLNAEAGLQRAGIGRGRDFRVAPDQRGDRIRWLGRTTLSQCLFLDAMEHLRRELNRYLLLGLFEFEAHFALYPMGHGYRRHLDSFRGAANRMVSIVLYLNEDWGPDDGGELVLFDPAGDGVLARIPPRAGSAAVFLSETIPHQVLPANRPRASIAGWFRLR